MGNIQEVYEYRRKPIFPDRSHTPRSKCYNGKNNSPYHRVMAKSACYPKNRGNGRSEFTFYPKMINSVIKYGEPYSGDNKNYSFVEERTYRKRSPLQQSRNVSFEMPGSSRTRHYYENSPKSFTNRRIVKDVKNFEQPYPSPTNFQSKSLSQSLISSKNHRFMPDSKPGSNNLRAAIAMNKEKISIQADFNQIETERKNYNERQFYHGETESKKPKLRPMGLCSFDESIRQQEPSKVHLQNKVKCQEMIKKVRNFNDFLNEVKKKLKLENYHQNTTSFDQETNSYQQNSMQTDSRSVVMSIKLENEKIQLEKYRKLVSKQLSKQHSIESIDIENGKNDSQKIIRINFDGQNTIGNKKTGETNKTNQNKVQTAKKPKDQQVNSRIKQKYFQVSKKVDELGQIIVAESSSLTRRMSKINSLMSHLEGVNLIQEQSCQQLALILKDQM